MSTENTEMTDTPTPPPNCPMVINAVPPSKFKQRILSIAEILDAIRFVPRLILGGYAFMVYKLYIWYTDIGAVVQTKCDAALIQILVDNGQNLEMAQQLACTIVDMVGGPTTAQTAFVTTVIGLATPLFGFYAATGRVWGKGDKK